MIRTMRSFRSFLVIGSVFLLVILVIAVFFVLRAQLSAPSSRYTVTVSPQTVIEEIRSLNRLETASFTIEKVIDAGTQGNAFQQILFGDRILLIAHGEVIAGVDLSKLTENDIAISDRNVRLVLPPTEILVTTLDNDQTRVYDRRRGLLTKGDNNLESEARKAAEETIRSAACSGNILGEASKNAKSQLTAFLQALKFSSVEVVTSQASCT